eukprot:TRINITY_DN27425_c0_g3_i1.p1 TRINITY_DN27425_c0_g3~~TRINITY_DN27425_c0_g3_i1.p1  ORF type:complete len:623 (-),score=13.96 TRINITY_DN27425_c0_g3_i1:173-2041(-)
MSNGFSSQTKLRGDWDVRATHSQVLRGDWDVTRRPVHAREVQAPVAAGAKESVVRFKDSEDLGQSVKTSGATGPNLKSELRGDIVGNSQTEFTVLPTGSLLHAVNSRLSDIRFTCTTSIRQELLRAVSISEVLSDFGRHWSSNDGCDEDYKLSRIVDRISVFVSHDWGTPRIVKCVALLCYGNLTPAVLLSCLASMVVPVGLRAVGIGFSESDGIYDSVCGEVASPRLVALWAAATGFSIFGLVFSFWQRMRSLCCSPITVFLDKLCIHQVDLEQKAAGILGLAAFLKVSESLVVLWTKRYFTRLWCTYELAAWCKLGKDFASTVTFVPAEAALRLFALICSCAATLLAYELVVITFHVPSTVVWILWLFFGVLYCGFSMQTYRELYTSLNTISMQLEAYKVGEANCFCCSCRHIDPLTGAAMKCDRELVMRTLRTWRHQETGQSEDTAEHYNAFVTRELRVCRDMLLESVSSVKHAFLLTLAILWGNVARICAVLVWAAAGDNPHRFAVCGSLRYALTLTIDILQLMIGWKLLFYIARRSSASTPETARPPRVKISFLLGFVVLLVILVWRVVCFRIFLWATPTIMAVYSIVICVIMVWCYWPFSVCVRRRSSESLHEEPE